MEDPLAYLHWLVIALLVLIFAELWRRTHNLPPGPWGLPILGFYPLFGKEPHRQMYEFSKRYGDVLSFRTMGGTLVVMLNERSVVKEVFVNRAEEFLGKPEQLNFLNWFDGGLGIAQQEGNAWREQRKFFISCAKNFGFGKMEYEGFLHELIKKMVKSVRSSCDKPHDMFIDITYVTCGAVAKVMCNKEFDMDDPMFLKLARGFDDIVAPFIVPKRFFLFGPYLSLALKIFPWGQQAVKSKDNVMSITSKMLQEHIKTFDPHNLRDFVDAYLNHVKTLEEKGQLVGSSFTMERLNAILFNMLLEGTESTGGTILGLILTLSRYPDVQKKAQNEIDEIIGHDRLPSWADRPNMPYMYALLQELLRISPFIFFSMLYSNFKETTIASYRIPKRTVICANVWALNFDPKCFTNPSKFDPERFLGSDGRKEAQKVSPIVFGLGKRTCVGEPLAQMEVFLIVASLLQKFTLYATDNERLVRIEPRE